VIALNLSVRTVGLVVDAVCDVLQRSTEHARPDPQGSCAIDGGFTTGIGTIQGRMMIPIDSEALIRSADMGLQVTGASRLPESQAPTRRRT
jgi:purine-binding chemotaxis protein CheW